MHILKKHRLRWIKKEMRSSRQPGRMTWCKVNSGHAISLALETGRLFVVDAQNGSGKGLASHPSIMNWPVPIMCMSSLLAKSLFHHFLTMPVTERLLCTPSTACQDDIQWRSPPIHVRHGASPLLVKPLDISDSDSVD